MSYQYPLEIDEDFKKEFEDENSLNKIPITSNYNDSNFESNVMSSPIMSSTRRYKTFNANTIYSSPRRQARNKDFHEVNLDHESYDEEDDEDYYPTSSDAHSEDEDEEVENDNYKILQRIKPEVNRIEKIVIFSTFIGTALGVIIGYILFLYGNES